MERKEPKIFVKASYERNNDWGISKVKDYLKGHGYTIHEKEEDYGLDIKAEKEGKIVYFEVEVKHNYPFTDRDSFKFDTVSFLARKKKWAEENFWYIIICGETLSFVMAKSSVIFQKEYSEEINIDSYERFGKDYFYRVPKDKCYFYKDLKEFIKS